MLAVIIIGLFLFVVVCFLIGLVYAAVTDTGEE